MYSDTINEQQAVCKQFIRLHITLSVYSGLTLSQSSDILAEVKSAISNGGGQIGQKIQAKLDVVLRNNPGLSKMTGIAKVQNGEEAELEIFETLFCCIHSSLMSNSKHLSPFVFDVLCYLNRDQLERFSIVCRSLKNIIERYFHSKPYRIFDFLVIHGGSYALFHQGWQWHPNRDDYSVQQFLGGEACSNVYSRRYYSFAEMRPYLGPNIRIENTSIYADAFAYNPNRIAEMESITYLWRNGKVSVQNYVISIFNNIEEYSRRIGAEDFLPIRRQSCSVDI
ncbi:hypothetical protein DdX_15138 [Ditylenchus destructor]|uniref:F-box domain-containing protein n=1 Tax=Ditylenchus destructor TaxID=166010 RepID=A0AAD4R197_9BILA|nr:hypothetical protein DdX_15138 [Ditylenchus destructor]